MSDAVWDASTMKDRERASASGPGGEKKPLFLFKPSSLGEMELPKVKGMEFETEGGLNTKNPPWGLVRSALGLLDPGEGNSFAILSLSHNSFVQVLRGTNGFHLEWRVTGDDLETYIHYRACSATGSTDRRLLKKHDGLNDGQQRDLLDLESVIPAFRAFFDRKAPPGDLHWRVLDI